MGKKNFFVGWIVLKFHNVVNIFSKDYHKMSFDPNHGTIIEFGQVEIIHGTYCMYKVLIVHGHDLRNRNTEI